jgi:hypothetical protein
MYRDMKKYSKLYLVKNAVIESAISQVSKNRFDFAKLIVSMIYLKKFGVSDKRLKKIISKKVAFKNRYYFLKTVNHIYDIIVENNINLPKKKSLLLSINMKLADDDRLRRICNNIQGIEIKYDENHCKLISGNEAKKIKQKISNN